MASFSVCSLFGLPFVLLCFLSVYPFLSLSRYVPYPFRSMACKKRRGTQVQIVSRIDPPPPARPARYRSDGRPRIISDIGRSHGRPSIPPEDRFGPFGSEPAWPSAAAFLLLDRYRSLEVHVVSMDHPVPYLVLDRYIGKWADPDIGSDKWSKLGLWLHSSDSSLFGSFDPWGKWSKWFWLIYSFEPIYR